MPTDGKLSGREIKELFFTEVETADGVTQFRCRCGKIRAQSLKHGYTNLSQHVLVKHEDWYSAAVRNANVVPAPSAAGQLNGGRKSPAKSRSQSPSANSDERVAAPSPPTERTDTAIDEEEKQEETTQEATPVVTPATDEANDGTKKRADYLSWDDYFMSVAFLSAMRSKDPSTQVGACIVNPDKKIVGIGYNGFPNGCSDDQLPWARSSASDSPLETKYPYVCHAEMNAILNKNSTDVKGCTIYVALFPCNECAKLIIQSGISRVVYCSDKYRDDWKFVASRRLLDMAGVKCSQHQLHRSHVLIDFSAVE